jgi:hypothetical protein
MEAYLLFFAIHQFGCREREKERRKWLPRKKMKICEQDEEE